MSFRIVKLALKSIASVLLPGIFGLIIGREFIQHEVFREILSLIAIMSLSGFSGYAISKTILKL